jgi:hypothetical protein
MIAALSLRHPPHYPRSSCNGATSRKASGSSLSESGRQGILGQRPFECQLFPSQLCVASPCASSPRHGPSSRVVTRRGFRRRSRFGRSSPSGFMEQLAAIRAPVTPAARGPSGRGTAAVLELTAAPAWTPRIPPDAPSGGAWRLAKAEQGDVHHQDEEAPAHDLEEVIDGGDDLQAPGRVAGQIERRPLQKCSRASAARSRHSPAWTRSGRGVRSASPQASARARVRPLQPGVARMRAVNTGSPNATGCQPYGVHHVARLRLARQPHRPMDEDPAFPRPRSRPRACSRGPAPPPVPPRRVPPRRPAPGRATPGRRRPAPA